MARVGKRSHITTWPGPLTRRRRRTGNQGSNIGGGKPPFFECDQKEALPSKFVPGQFKVNMPTGRVKFSGPYRSIG